MYRNLPWLLVATKLLAAKLHSLYVKGSESGVESVSEISELDSKLDILPPMPQPFPSAFRKMSTYP